MDSDSDSYDNQFGDEIDELEEDDTKFNHILNDIILSVESNKAEILTESVDDSLPDSVAANQLFDKIFAKNRSNVPSANQFASLACAEPLTPVHVRSKSAIPNQIDDSPPPSSPNIDAAHSNSARNSLHMRDNVNKHNGHKHVHNINDTNEPFPYQSKTPQITHVNHIQRHSQPPPLPHYQQSAPMMPQRHSANMNSPMMMSLNPSNSVPVSPISPPFPNVNVAPDIRRPRSYDPLPSKHQAHVLQVHSVPVTSEYQRHSIQHMESVPPQTQYYQQPIPQKQPYQWAAHELSNHNNTQYNNHKQQRVADPWQNNIDRHDHGHSSSVSYVNNRNNGNTVHIMYNININDPHNVYNMNRNRQHAMITSPQNHNKHNNHVNHGNIQHQHHHHHNHNNTMPVLSQSISPTSSVDELIAKPPHVVSKHKEAAAAPVKEEEEFIPPAPHPIIHPRGTRSNTSHAPTIVEGPGSKTTAVKKHSNVDDNDSEITDNDDFIPPSPKKQSYNYNGSKNEHSSVSHQSNSNNERSKDTAHKKSLHIDDNDKEGSFKSNNSVFGDDTSSDSWDENEDSSSSDSWATKQKQFALTTFSNVGMNMHTGDGFAMNNNIRAADTYQSSEDTHQYVIDAIFNIKKFSQPSETVLTMEEFEASFVNIVNIPRTLNEDEEVRTRSTRSTRSSKLSKVSSPRSVISDPNILQLKEIIWSVTNPQNTAQDGIQIRDVLLLCHPIFVESVDLLKLLKKRFLTQEKEISDSVQWQIQSKVTVFLQHWMRHYYYQDFELCSDNRMNKMLIETIKAMREYFEKRKSNKIFEKGEILPKSIEKAIKTETAKLKRAGLDSRTRRRTKAMSVLVAIDEKEPDVVNKKAQEKNDKKFWNEDNKKIAQEVTLMAFEFFSAIEPRECLCQNWKKKDKELRAPNILKSVEFFNNLSKYISMTILSGNTAKQRGKLIRKWIKIGGYLLELHNFDSLAAVQGTLTSTPIYRLKKEWKYVGEKHLDKFKELKKLYARAKNNANLRQIIRITPPPMIPYTGIFLQDLFVIEESRDTKQKDGTINFPKLMALHSSIKRVQVLQKAKYTDHFKENAPIQQFIKEGLKRYAHLTSQAIYDNSMQVSQLKKKK